MVNIEELKPHEEVIHNSVSKLARKILHQGLLRDPLIVDREHSVILDGMHRFASLKLLKCRYVPCCLVDYDSPQIKVGSWFRLFKVQDTERLAEEVLKENRLDFSKVSVELANASYKPEVAILTRPGAAYLLPGQLDMIQRARTAVSLEKAMEKRGHPAEYLSEIVALEELKSGEVNFIVALPIFTKEQIRESGLTGNLLPHKVTRHVIPSRPLWTNVPLALLTDPASSDEAERMLVQILAQRKVERKPPGSVVDGRRYQEELLIFRA